MSNKFYRAEDVQKLVEALKFYADYKNWGDLNLIGPSGITRYDMMTNAFQRTEKARLHITTGGNTAYKALEAFAAIEPVSVPEFDQYLYECEPYQRHRGALEENQRIRKLMEGEK